MRKDWIGGGKVAKRVAKGREKCKKSGNRGGVSRGRCSLLNIRIGWERGGELYEKEQTKLL